MIALRNNQASVRLDPTSAKQLLHQACGAAVQVVACSSGSTQP